ncbi:MAG: hypothetical protein HY912_05340 [Desulfomonile tiedjei]|uniref:Uncharacterized protein n=1 Tax=Desulfomonile tiedjei TaxID=2358 RepID=A0A9D6UZV0_9BACT|nr:hypothetical protein [Desulfomonile tiedjei]
MVILGHYGSRVMKGCSVLAVLAIIAAMPVAVMAIGTPITGYTGWTYLNSGGYDWYFYNDWGRFAYQQSSGVWYNYDKYSRNWNTLSSKGASSGYIFDGFVHDLINGWGYLYNTPSENGHWTKNGVYHFAYNYSMGQWYDYDIFGGGWKNVGVTSLSAYFLGNGLLKNVGNGWSFIYDNTNDTGLWARSGGLARFGYNYSSGQWYEYDSYGGPWQIMGSTGRTSSFLGSGSFRGLGNGWSFLYDYTNDTGLWAGSAAGCLGYNYSKGAWYNYDSFAGWQTLSATGRSSKFVGNGDYYNLGWESWWYKYANGTGYYAYYEGSYDDEFYYTYSSGQWYYKAETWYALSSAGKNCALKNIAFGDLGLEWSFGDGIDTSSFDFDISNTKFWSIEYDGNADGIKDQLDYYDNLGHKVAHGIIQMDTNGKSRRIGIDQTYVVPGWSTYFAWLSGSTEYDLTAYSPLVVVYDNYGNVLFKQTFVQHITLEDSSYSTGLRNGQAWIWEDANGSGSYDSNQSETGDRIIRWYQQKGGTCGLFTCINIARSVWGNGSPQTVYPDTYVDDTITWFSDYCGFVPPYDPATMDLNDPEWSTYSAGPGMPSWVAYLTQDQNFNNGDLFTWNTSWFDTIVNAVESGRLVGIGLNCIEIYQSFFPEYDALGTPRDADLDGYLDAGYQTTGNSDSISVHSVWCRGFQRDESGNITHAIIEDSAWLAGAVARIPLEHFLRAFAFYDGHPEWTFAIAVDVPTGKSWSTSGINTWRFNPYLWTTTWTGPF